MEVHKGKIVGFAGSFFSGVAYLAIEDEEGTVKAIQCENGPTVRAMESAFGNVIGEGHTVIKEGGYMDKEIYWSDDGFGVLVGFTPIEEVTAELLEKYKKTKGLETEG